eukprot:5244251-Alexandrium_andersonii.AAC.1
MLSSPPHRPSPGCHTRDSRTQPEAGLVPVAALTQGGVAHVCPKVGRFTSPEGCPRAVKHKVCARTQ